MTTSLASRFCATLDREMARELPPQGIHWCLCLPEAPTGGLGPDGHPRRDLEGSFLPPIPLPRRMWASSAMEFHAPIAPGAHIERTSTLASIAEKEGQSGPLVFVDVTHETLSNGALAVAERQTIVFREATTAAPPPRPADGPPDLADWPLSRTVTPSEAMLFRYSALTFNSHRIHYDRPYAEVEEGYRGLVVHGPLMATLLLDLMARAHGPDRVAQFAFRAVSPAFAGEPLYLAARPSEAGWALAAFGADGRTVVTADATLR